jgi:hypothetical protein
LKHGQRVFLIGNALPPGFGTPSAAPGLRVWGLRQGLEANGVDATIVIPANLVARQQERWAGQGGVASVDHVVILDRTQVQDYLVDQGPATVLMTNSGSIGMLQRHPRLRIGMDFFSPTVLEHSYRAQTPIEDVIEAKREAIAMADFYYVNGVRRIPYCHGWLAACAKELADFAMPSVNMCVPAGLPGDRRDENLPLRLMVAGYDQAWAPLTPILRILEDLAARLPLDVTVVSAADYWREGSADEFGAELARLALNPAFHILDPMPYEDLGARLRQADVFVDLFANNIERQYSMSTRGVVALAHGVPLLHPRFTELGGLLHEFDAGWTDVEMGVGLSAHLERLILDLVRHPDIVQRKRSGAMKLLFEHFNPARETAKLLPFLQM